MKGPQKRCCREFLKRKLDSILNQGRNVAARLVSAKLSGDYLSLEFSASHDEVAERFSRSILSLVQAQAKAIQEYGSFSIGERGEKKFDYEIMVVLRKHPG